MASNLTENVKAALKCCNIRSVPGWTDSTVVLHWLNRQGLYKQFVANRVTNIFKKVHKVGLCPNQTKPCKHRKQG